MEIEAVEYASELLKAELFGFLVGFILLAFIIYIAFYYRIFYVRKYLRDLTDDDVKKHVLNKIDMVGCYLEDLCNKTNLDIFKGMYNDIKRIAYYYKKRII